MALIDNIIQIRDDSLSALDASHNYHVHTTHVWRTILQQIEHDGLKIIIQNQETGDTIDQSQLSGLAQGYVTEHLASATFQRFVSLFERFVFDFIGAWLTEYPASLADKQLTFRSVLDSADKDAIVGIVVQKEIIGLAYQRVADWFAYLDKIAKLGCPNTAQIEKLAEIKASRDVLVHNNGIANAIYVQKSRGNARFEDGENLELPADYHRASWQLMRQVIVEITDAAKAKLSS